MTAKEMFDLIGYKVTQKTYSPFNELEDTWLVFNNEKKCKKIIFSLTMKTVHGRKYEKDSGIQCGICSFTPQEIQAITQQMKELGTIE